MATVKISKELIGQVMSKARSIHSERIYSVNKGIDLCGWTSDKMMEFILGQDLLATLRRPEMQPFVNTVTELHLESVNGVAAGITLSAPSSPMPFAKGRSVEMTIADSTGAAIGQAWLTQHYSGTTGYIKLSAPNDKLNGLVEELQRVRDEKRLLMLVQEEYVLSVEKVLDSFATLAPALKAWPALWELLPEETKDKHKQVRGKPASRSAPAVDVDLAKLTAITAAHRLGV
jgi:hypothetical protein